MRVKVRTLSPIHVGSGERLSALDYVLENEKVKVFDFEKVLEAIEKLPNKQTRINAFLWFKNTKNPNLRDFLSAYNLKVEPLYTLPVKGQIQTSQIEQFIRSVSGPYVPGSELKGAIRKLILSCILIKSGFDWLIERLNQLVKLIKELDQQGYQEGIKEKRKKLINEITNLSEELDRRYFYSKGSKDAKFDVFKALQVSDSAPIGYDSMRVDTPKLVGSSRKLFPCEVIKEGQEFEMEIKLNRNALKVFQIYPLEHRELLEAFSDEQSFWQFLSECSKSFYQKLIEEEIRFFKDFPKTVEHLENIKETLSSLVVLRLGKHEGFLSTTVMLLVKERDKRLFDEVFSLTQSFVRNEKNKTRRINADGLTFGWVALEKL